MKKRSILYDKKADTVILETTIFMILNLVFIVLLLIFVYGSGKGAFVYGEKYAKQIALLIDNAEPDMIIGLNMEDAVRIAEENGKSKDKIVSINKEENKVIVSLSPKGGHSYQYFSDYDVSTQLTENYLTIKIRGKNE